MHSWGRLIRSGHSCYAFPKANEPPMTSSDSPDAALQNFLEEMAAATKRYGDERYRQGFEDASARMRRSLAGALEQAGVGPPAPIKPAKKQIAPLSIPPMKIEGRPYGAVIQAIRHVLRESDGTGVTAAEMLKYCRDSGIETTMLSIRDCLKRLKNGEEAENMHGAYFRGPRLKLPSETGPPSMGYAERQEDAPQRYWNRTGPSKKSRILVETLALIDASPEHKVHRSAILDRLVKQGIMGHEKRPVQSLSVQLSEFTEIEPTGDGCWRRKRDAQRETAPMRGTVN